MSCKKISTKKYLTRKSPPYSAMSCKNKTKKGKNGETYKSIPNRLGIYQWKIIKNKSKDKHTIKHKKMVSYKTHDNGDRPFQVFVYPSKVEVFRLTYNYNTYEDIKEKLVLDTPYQEIFIGDNLLNSPNYAKKGKYPGNSILLHLKDDLYIFIGHKIYTFQVREDDMIIEYYSPVGNSDVPYPYAVGKNNTYFMLDERSVSNDELDLKKDGYEQFYSKKRADKTFIKKSTYPF
jgi:hypothetical protein